jgi:hypothetical protein
MDTVLRLVEQSCGEQPPSFEPIAIPNLSDRITVENQVKTETFSKRSYVYFSQECQ